MTDGAAPEGRHQSLEAVIADDRPWDTLRWPGQWS
jgi:hypothetical protein